MNKGQYELAKERKQQEYYDLDIKQLEHKNAAKRYSVDAEKIKIDIARESVSSAKLSLEQAKTSNSIASEKLNQLKDNLAFEKGVTKINQQILLTQANQAVLSLSSAKNDLDEGRKLHELKYGKASETINIHRSLGS